MKLYKEIFNGVEKTLKYYSKLSEEEFESSFGFYKFPEDIKFTNDKYYNLLMKVVFYSGFKAETVTNKMAIIENYFPNYQVVAEYDKKMVNKILADQNMIKNERKINACIENAKKFQDIIEKHDSFESYVNSFKPKESFENLMLFKEEISYQFKFLGGVTAYHFMTDIGLPVLKPDRVITRIFKRIGLIEDEKQLLKTVIQGMKFSQETHQPLRYIDIIFVKFGQKGKDDFFGLQDGICLKKNAKCKLCKIKEHCDFYNHGTR